MTKPKDREALLLRDEFCDPDCECDHGRLRVHPKYAEGRVPGDLEAEHAALLARVEARARGEHDFELDAELDAYAERRRLRMLAAEDVYPCPDCRPAQYARWRAGCYRANHARKRCKVCGPDAEPIEPQPPLEQI